MTQPARNALDVQQTWDSFKAWLLAQYDHIAQIPSANNGKGAWATDTAYVINEYVVSSGATYACMLSHTSDVFATDMAAGKWALFDTTFLRSDLAAPSGASLIGHPSGMTVEDAITFLMETPVSPITEAASDAERNAAFAAGYAMVIRTDRIAADTTAPTTSSGPSIGSITSTSAAFTAAINEAGTGYYLLLPSATAAPSVSTLSSTGAAFAMSAGVATGASLAGLSDGATYKLHFVAKDTAGNFQSAIQTVAFTATSTGDGLAPVVATFTVGTPSGLTVSVTAFTAADAVGVTGYLITESSTPPASGTGGWTGSAPTSYTTGSVGSKTLYPWAKDAAGNVSAVFGLPRAATFTPVLTTIFSNDGSTLAGVTAGPSIYVNGTIYGDVASSGDSAFYWPVTPFSTNSADRRFLAFDFVLPVWAAGTPGVNFSSFYMGLAADSNILLTDYANWHMLGAASAVEPYGLTHFTNSTWSQMVAPASVVAGRTYHATVDVPGNGTMVSSITDTVTGVTVSHTETFTVTITCVKCKLAGSTATSPRIDNVVFSSY